MAARKIPTYAWYAGGMAPSTDAEPLYMRAEEVDRYIEKLRIAHDKVVLFYVEERLHYKGRANRAERTLHEQNKAKRAMVRWELPPD